jgi:hypothetical protein
MGTWFFLGFFLEPVLDRVEMEEAVFGSVMDTPLTQTDFMLLISQTIVRKINIFE